jgi:hypothetical protein
MVFSSLLGFFNRSQNQKFSRHAANHKSQSRRLFLEPLEERRVLAINVAVVQDIAFGDPAGFVATRDQLNNDTFFDFNASLVNSSQVDTLAELNAFDVVIIGDNGFGNPDAFSNTAFTAALRNWVENHAGGVVMTGWGVFGAGAGTPPANPDIDAIIPVNTSGGHSSFGAPVNINIVATHPITTGLGPNLLITSSGPSNFVEFPTSSPQLDPGATLLGQISGQPVIAASNKGTGRGIYLGPIYAGYSGWGTATLRSGDPDRLLEQSVAWAAGAVAPVSMAKVYRTSLDPGPQPFNVYDVATNTWTNLGTVETAGQMAVSPAGELFMLQRPTNTIQKYNPATNTWSFVKSGPSGFHTYGNLEITSSGEFLFTELNSNILHYTVGGIGGVWQQLFMPAPASALGDYDPITNDIFIVQSNSEVVRSIDVSTFSQTVYSFGAGGSGEIRRFGDILNGRFYQLRDSAPPKFYQIGNPAAPLTTMAPLPIIADWESAAVDDASGIMYLNNLFGTGAFSRWDPATNSQVLLAAPPSFLGNHSSLAFVPGSTNQPPTAPVDINPAANSVPEGAPNGTPVGISAFSTDPNGQTPIYSLTNNAGGRFAINPATGVVSVANAALLDGPGSHTIQVQASDGVGGTSSALFSIAVTNVNPTASLNAPASIVYGNSVNVSLTGASDASTADASSLRYAVAYATTNSSPLTGVTYAGSSAIASASFASLDAGSYWVFARVIDKDDGFTEYSQQLTVDQADALVSITPYSGTYDAAAHNLTGSVVGVAGDPSASGSSLTFGLSFTDAPGGTGSWTFEGGTNYLDESGTAAIDIAQADALVSITPYSGTYDAAAHNLTGSVVGVAGDPSASGSSLTFGLSFTDAPGGTGSWTFEGGTNYLDESGTAAIDIAQADANVTINPYSDTYDAAAHNLAGSVTGVAGDPSASGSSLTFGLSFTDAPGGTGSWTFEGGTNYLDESGAAAIDIAQASISHTIGNTAHVYGSTVNLALALGTTIDKGVNGETLAIAYDSAGNTVLANAGSYPITGVVSDGSGLASNYAVTLTPGTLTVTQATITGNATTQDALNMAKQGKLTITISNVAGLLNGDTLLDFLSTAEYYITVGANKYAFVPTTVTTLGSNITVAYTLKNSALVTQLAAELADNTSGATAVASGFSMESLNYLFTDDYLTRLFSTVN